MIEEKDIVIKLKKYIDIIENINKYSYDLLTWFHELDSLIQNLNLSYRINLINMLSQYEMEIKVSRYSIEYINEMYIKLGEEFIYSLEKDLNGIIEKEQQELTSKTSLKYVYLIGFIVVLTFIIIALI